ncbi:hypothetical protein NHQ30_000529 [Ciborinia camelliae]|nr:hypothetical protein NHQ30_000529 [Ciborinia camelliae]
MLSTPLTPPYEPLADSIENDSSAGRTLTLSGESDTSYTNQLFALSTPTSNSSMMLNDPIDTYASESRSLSEDVMEESDQDMSDGGVPLTMTHSYAEELNAEMDTLDTEIMGQENPVGLHHGYHFQSSITPFYPGFLDQLAVPSEPGGSSYQSQGNIPIPEPINTTDLPAVMSEVSQQLQHIQDGQEHGDFELATGEHHDMFLNHNQSTSPLDSFNLLDDLLTTASVPAPTLVEPGDLEMGHNSSSNSVQPTVSISDAQHFHSSDVAWDDQESVADHDVDHDVDHDADHDVDLDADQLEVDNQFNMNFGDFLNDWARSLARRGLNQTRTKGPSQTAINSHCLARNLQPVRRCDLQGEKCDIQRIDWKDLGVTRLEARQRRRITYRNYTNLVYPNRPQLHISTLTSGHDIVVAGGFEGQYALTSTRAEKCAKHIEGVITEHPNDITNHAQVHLSRSSSPLVTFASNDSGIRTLDVTTNKFISEHMYDHAINCTAVSPDRRLRVLVGDTRKVMICSSDTGEILQELDGHLDYGFACDWSEDGWMVATGNQDMQVKIWDARYWNRPVASIAADMAGVRKLKFSPLGSGRPILVAAEPADYVNIINAETFDSKQTLSFFGEIGGFDFTNDGQELIVANCDPLRGGILEFERCDFATEGLCGKDEQIRFVMAGKKRDYGLSSMAEDLLKESPDLRGTTKRRERRAALLTDLGSF